MPRQATGELRHLADGFAARITIQGRERQDFPLPTCATEPEALLRCKALASMAARLRRAGQIDDLIKLLELGAKARAGRPWEAVVAAVEALCSGQARDKTGPAIPTLAEWGRAWTSGELHKKYPDHVKDKDHENDEQLLRKYITPHVGDVRVDEFTLEHADFVMANLPEKSRHNRPLEAGTRRHIAQCMGRLLNMAVYPGRYRKETPIPRGWLPKPGPEKAKEALYPDEEALLLAGKAKEPGQADVPLLRRVAYGVLAREGLREGELVRLRWSDVDLVRGRINLDENKTDDPRDWELQPDVVRALARWKKLYQPGATADDHVLAEDGVPLNVERLAEQLRGDLVRVGVDRPKLFVRSRSRVPMRAHDLRATFVTVALATGRTETWTMDRTGHADSTMVNRYRRKARSWSLGPLGPLDVCIPELTEEPGSEYPTENPTNHSRTWRNRQTHQIQVGQAPPTDSRSIEKTTTPSDPTHPEIAPVGESVGQSWGNRMALLEAAIAKVTKAIASAGDDDDVADLVSERKEMRAELRSLREKAAGVASLDERRRSGR